MMSTADRIIINCGTSIRGSLFLRERLIYFITYLLYNICNKQKKINTRATARKEKNEPYFIYAIADVETELADSKSGKEIFEYKIGAGEGSRTLVASLGSWCITVMLHPHFRFPIQYSFSAGVQMDKRKNENIFLRMIPFYTISAYSSAFPAYG